MAEEKKMINGGDVLIKCLLKEDIKYMIEDDQFRGSLDFFMEI